MNIGLVNEQKQLFLKLGIDPFEVFDAAATKPFGFMKFEPGPGIGGHCIPIDPHYLAWRAREAGLDPRFIELAGEVNRRMPGLVADRVAAALAEDGIDIRNARVLVLGLAYKADVADTRESPALEVLRLLRGLGAGVGYSDPHVPEAPDETGLRSVPLTADTLAAAHAVVVVTAHAAFDFRLVADHARLVIDTRNAMAAVATVRSPDRPRLTLDARSRPEDDAFASGDGPRAAVKSSRPQIGGPRLRGKQPTADYASEPSLSASFVPSAASPQRFTEMPIAAAIAALAARARSACSSESA